MSQLADVEISRKASILSVLSEKFEEKRKSLSPIDENEKVPNDNLYIAYLGCFFLGFMNIMPLIFFGTASVYWMYKFRDPRILSETTAGANRTTLQSYFLPSSMVAQTLPTVIVTSILTVYGHKISAMKRVIWSLVGQILLFCAFVLFTQINTDSWQTEFFVLTIGLLVVDSGLLATTQISSVVLLAKLPQKYMLCFLLGQSGTYITTLIQIISLSVTDHSPTSGLIYFVSGTFLVCVSLLIFLAARKSSTFKYYEVEDVDEKKPETIVWSESKHIFKKIWPCQFVFFITITTITFIHPAITTLVVSEYESDKTAWTEKYFTPVSVFLMFEISSVIGRITSRNLYITPKNKWWFVGACVLRMVVIIPLYIFLNAQPRNLPVILNKDWEFLLLNAFQGYTLGVLLNSGFMSLKTLSPDKPEAALKLASLILSITNAATTANGLLMVKVLQL